MNFLNIFKFVKQGISPSFLGVDIGTASIKIVEVEEGEKAPRLLNYAILENKASILRSNAAFHTSNLKLFDKEMIEFLKLIVKKTNFSTNQAFASLPVFNSFTTILKFPEMNDEEIKKALFFEAKQYIPLSISEVALDWQKIGEYEDEKGVKFNAIFLAAVPQELIKKYQYIFSSAGLNLNVLEIEPLSLIRSVIFDDLTPTILVDIGNYTTSISLVENKMLKFTTNIDFGGSSLTHALATALNINPLRAEEIKIERGILNMGADYELIQVFLPILDMIIGEIDKLKFRYQNTLNKSFGAERAILCGRGANLLGIDSYFSKKLNIPVFLASPLNRFEYPQNLAPLAKELNTTLSTALGLTLRGFKLK
jgi:type IV pilus assembly protein PilM